jgi:hypothetical protein
MKARIHYAFGLVLFLAAGTVGAKPMQVASVEVPNSEYTPGFHGWCRKGTLMLWTGLSNDVTVRVYPPGKPSWSVLLPETAGSERTIVKLPLDLKYMIVQTRQGATHTFHSFKVTPKQLKHKATYTMLQPDGAEIPRAECVDSRVFIAQQTTTTGVTAVRLLTRALKQKLSEDMDLCPGMGSWPSASVSPHGRYIVADTSYDAVSNSYTVVFYKVKGSSLSDVGSSLRKGTVRWLPTRRDSVLCYPIPSAGSMYEVDALAPLQRLAEFATSDQHDFKADASGRPAVAVVYTNKTLRIFRTDGEMGPYQLTDSTLTDRVEIVSFRKLLVVLAFHNNAGPYSVRAYRITRKGLKPVAGPVTGMRFETYAGGPNGKYIVINDREQSTSMREGVNASPGPYYRFYTRKLKIVDTITCQGNSYLRERGLLGVEHGGSSTTFTIWNW